MNQRVLIVETDPSVFADWTNPEYGLGARLDAMGLDGDAVELEGLKTAEDLATLASDVKTSRHLPARVLLLSGIEHSSLGFNEPIDKLPNKAYFAAKGRRQAEVSAQKPQAHDETTDGPWSIPGDWAGLLYPYTRLISRRLVQRAVPDVNFNPSDEVIDAWERHHKRSEEYWRYVGSYRSPFAAFRDLFEETVPHDRPVLRAEYGGWLARTNRYLAVTGQDFMTIVDGRGHGRFDEWTIYHGGTASDNRESPKQRKIGGADINIVHPDIPWPDLMDPPYTGDVIETLVARNKTVFFRKRVTRQAYDTWFRLANEPMHSAHLNYIQGPRMWLAANLLAGKYPKISSKDQELDIPRQEILEASF